MFAAIFQQQINILTTTMSVLRRYLCHILMLLCWCLSLLLPATAHTDSMHPPLLSPLTTEQGLTSGTVNRLAIDQQGFLWLATDRGLNRFDANNVQQIPLAGDTQIELNISQVFTDSQQRFFVAAQNQGLYQLNLQTSAADLILPLQQMSSDNLPQLFDVIEQQPNLLLLAINKAVYQLQLPGKQLTRIFEFDGGNSLMSRVRLLTKFNQLLLIGTNLGLHVYDLKTKQTWQLQFSQLGLDRDAQMVRTLHVDNNQLLLAIGSQLYQLSETELRAGATQTLSNTPLLSDLQVTKILTQPNRLLLGTNKGLYQFLPGAQQAELMWRFTDSVYEIDQDRITDMVQAPDGGFWLASRLQGAYYWHPRSTLFNNIKLPLPQQPTLFPQAPGFSPRAVLAIAERAPDQLILSTVHGLKNINLATGLLQEQQYPSKLPGLFSPVVARIYPDDTDKLWLRSGNTLHLFSSSQAEFLPLPLQDERLLPQIQLNARGHWRDPAGAFWFYNAENYYRYQPADGSLTALAELKNAESVHRAGRFLGQHPLHPDQIFFSAADRIWLFNQTERTVRKIYQAAPYEPNLGRYADKMCVDGRGDLWFTVSGLGLLNFDAKQLQLKHHLNKQNGLVNNAIYSCETDRNGQLWFASQQGLTRLDPSTLQLEHFNKNDGLSGSDFVYAASLQLSNGNLVYGTNAGLTWFDPITLVETPLRPSIAITHIGTMNQPRTVSLHNLDGESFSFDHDSLGIEVSFSALNFRDSDKIQYKFWLEGQRDLHFPAQNSAHVTFPRLDPGVYTFHVKAISPHNGLESAPAVLTLKIKPSPWYSTAALTSYVILALLLLFIWQQNRLAQRRLLAQAHFKVIASEQRLKQALEAVNSGVWDYHAQKNSMYAQRVHAMLGYSEELNPLSMQQHLALIHPDDRDSYEQNWQRFIGAPDRSFDFTYRMQHKNGRWLWFRDIGKVTETEGSQALRIIGTYSNITESRATKEKARLFGEAFQQTRDWVVLLDPEQRVLAANQSFTDVFGDMDEYLNNPQVHTLGISLSRRRFYTRLLHGMQPNQHWQGEELVQNPDGSERPTLLNINAVGEDQRVDFYVLVFTDITAQKRAEDDLRYLANYDALTGLPNRALLMDRILHGIETAKREQRSLALCFIDLDRFKQINDSLGHDVGDLLLKQVAQRLTNVLRQTDTVARLGGDEFVVLLESYKNDDNISHVARKMLKSIGDTMQLSGHSVSVSPSIGIAVYPEDAADAGELLKHADVAMYHAKDLGRNNFQFFIQEMNEKAQMQLAHETRLRGAWQHNEFLNYYQPIYDSAQQKIVGVEVLMRWLDAGRLVPPNDFIPLAEDLRLIVPMTQALLVRALADLQQWHHAGYPIYMSVNLSPRHLEQQDLAEETARLLAQYQLPATCLRFEVTESALMQDHQSAIATMLALSALGVQLALDDFGTGYSSLKYLKELPIDGIKIDRSFVKDIGVDRNDETIIDAMLSMAGSLGMYCIAEGVETEQQLAFFSQRGCYLIQGYLFGKPMAAEQLLQQLQGEVATVSPR